MVVSVWGFLVHQLNIWVNILFPRAARLLCMLISFKYAK